MALVEAGGLLASYCSAATPRRRGGERIDPSRNRRARGSHGGGIIARGLRLGTRLTSIPRSDVTNPLACFKWSVDGSGLDSIVGLPHYGTRREAERTW